jgi:hypothetical protein
LQFGSEDLGLSANETEGNEANGGVVTIASGFCLAHASLSLFVRFVAFCSIAPAPLLNAQFVPQARLTLNPLPFSWLRHLAAV